MMENEHLTANFTHRLSQVGQNFVCFSLEVSCLAYMYFWQSSAANHVQTLAVLKIPQKKVLSSKSSTNSCI